MIRKSLSLFGFVKMADGDRVNFILLTKKLKKMMCSSQASLVMKPAQTKVFYT